MQHPKEAGFNLNDLLSRGGELNILEEEIDVEVQRQYMQYIERMSREHAIDDAALETIRVDSDRLFDASVEEEEKKRLLILLATVDDVAAYRKIESFSQLDTPLKKWATIALQQSRMLIQSTLLDESTVFVSTGLGGQGNLLRYFCVFMAGTGIRLQAYQHNTVKNETELAVAQSKGETESFEFHSRYVSCILLLPIQVNLKELFEGIIDECNTYGNFLTGNMIITNVKKMTPQEIDQVVQKRQAETD